MKILVAKTCPQCRALKTHSEFHKAGQYYQSWCKSCTYAKIRTYRKTPGGKALMQRYNQRAKARALGMEPDAYVAALEQGRAGGTCAICGREFPQLEVDHDHNTGRIRGHLCRACNIAIGLLGDDPGRIEAARLYLIGCF